MASSQLTSQRRRQWISWSLAVFVFFVGIAALRSGIRPSIDRDEIRTARVELGEVVASISAAGQVVPLKEQVVSALFESEVIEVLAAPGKEVAEGEAMLRLDGRALDLEVADLREQLALKENLRRSERLSLGQSLDASRSRLELLAIDLESREASLARFEALSISRRRNRQGQALRG